MERTLRRALENVGEAEVRFLRKQNIVPLSLAKQDKSNPPSLAKRVWFDR